MPTPIKREFYSIPKRFRIAIKASTIKGFKYGSKISIDELSDISVDFIVEGSVAVNVFGERIGKGEGYGANLPYFLNLAQSIEMFQ